MKSFINCKDCKYFLPYKRGWSLSSDGRCCFLERGGMNYRYIGRRRDDGCRYEKAKKVDKRAVKVYKRRFKMAEYINRAVK